MFRFISAFLIAILLLGVACRETPERPAPRRSREDDRASFSFVEKFPFAEKETDFFSLPLENPEAAACLVKGWSAVERNEAGKPFVWVIGRAAEIEFPVVERGPRDLVLQCGPMEPLRAGTQRANILVNGRWVAHLVLENGIRTYSVPIPEEVLREGRNLLDLRFAHAHSPAEALPGSRDWRKLAAAFHGLRIFPPGKDDPGAFALRIEKGTGEAPAIEQAEDTLLEYYVRVPEKARLAFSLRSGRRQPGDCEIQIDTDPPGPAKRVAFGNGRGEHSSSSEPLTVDLSEFSGRIARFRFRSSGGWWIDPVIRVPLGSGGGGETASQDALSRRRLEELRRRHEHANFVLCLLDAANPSHFGCYGYPKRTTPSIDRIAGAEGGIRFSNAFTQAPFTLCAVGSLFTGLFPESHGVMNRYSAMAEETPVLAESFLKKGFQTAGFVDTYAGASAYRFNRGFADYSEVFQARRAGRYDWRRADFVRQEVIPWIEEHRRDRFFVYLHLRQPHAPYSPPFPFRGKLLPKVKGRYDGTVPFLKLLDQGAPFSQADQEYLRGLYDGNLAVADEALGALFRRLEALDLFGKTVVLILADHGEAFGEHGKFEHSSTLYDEMIRIPMIWKLAGSCNAPKQVTQEVCLADVFPTLADLFSMETTRMRFDGRSILPSLCDSRAPDSRSIYSRTTDKSNLASLRNEEYKLILDLDSGKIQLFNLRADPQEKTSRADELPVLAGYMKAQLRDIRAAAQENAPKSTRTVQPDEGALKDMKALGYLE